MPGQGADLPEAVLVEDPRLERRDALHDRVERERQRDYEKRGNTDAAYEVEVRADEILDQGRVMWGWQVDG